MTQNLMSTDSKETRNACFRFDHTLIRLVKIWLHLDQADLEIDLVRRGLGLYFVALYLKSGILVLDHSFVPYRSIFYELAENPILLKNSKIRPRFGSHSKPLPTSADSPADFPRNRASFKGSTQMMLGRLRFLSGEIPEPHTLIFIYLLLHLILELTSSPPTPGSSPILSRGALNSLIKIGGCWIACSLLIRAKILEPKFISR
jgi:hypothetical protein